MPPEHATPQLPQLSASVCVFTQLPAHAVVPVGQLAVHMDAPHTWPVGHVVAHAPQWVGSFVRSTQTPPQLV